MVLVKKQLVLQNKEKYWTMNLIIISLNGIQRRMLVLLYMDYYLELKRLMFHYQNINEIKESKMMQQVTMKKEMIKKRMMDVVSCDIFMMKK